MQLSLFDTKTCKPSKKGNVFHDARGRFCTEIEAAEKQIKSLKRDVEMYRRMALSLAKRLSEYERNNSMSL